MKSSRSCGIVVSGTTLPSAPKTMRANGTQAPLDTAWYSRVCWKPVTPKVEEPVFCIVTPPDRLTVVPVFVTVATKLTGSPGTTDARSDCSDAVMTGRAKVLTSAVTAIDAQVFAPGAQAPAWQTSGLVQLFPSLHELPFAL